MTALHEAVARAIDDVQVWSRIVRPVNERSRIQICRYGIGDEEDEIVVLKEFSLDYGEGNARSDVVSDMRADAAIAAVFEAIREPTEEMKQAAERAHMWFLNGRTEINVIEQECHVWRAMLSTAECTAAAEKGE
jgi:hypothetical protein